jgi:hypothetical protein
MMIAAGREKRGLIPQPFLELKAEGILVKRDRAVEI